MNHCSLYFILTGPVLVLHSSVLAHVHKSYLSTHLLLFGRVDLDVLAQGAGVGVSLGAAGDLTRVWFL